MENKSLFVTLILASLFFMAISPINAERNSKSLITFSNFEQLDDLGKVLLGWEFDKETGIITFEMEVETTGFVGLGISPTGSMTGADIFIAGVFPNGTSYHYDCFGEGLTRPKFDAQDDWTLHKAVELGTVGRTFLKFSRLINTCDDEDYPIGNDTTRLIWAIGSTDEISYHNANRGAHAINLIGTPMPEIDLNGLDNWKMTLDMQMPKQATSYWCSFHKHPVVEYKHHIVAFDALLNGLDAKRHTHHFILYNCFLPPNSNQTEEQVFGNYTVDTGFLGYHCFEGGEGAPVMPVQYCTEYLYVWAKGGKMMTFPENVGYPIGEGANAGKQSYHMLEIHFDNPDELDNIRFETGVQFYYTNETREQDAGLLAVGHGTNIMITVPPNSTDFIIVGHCPSECTEWGIEPEEGITIFNSLLHAHMSGRKLKLRQFRGNTEVPWIDHDDHYDFDYQQNKPIEPTVLLPGDKLIYECTYDSTWNDGKVVVGGISSRNEMCQTFLWYFPRQEMDQCLSLFPMDPHLADFGITAFHDEQIMGEVVIIVDEPAYLRGPYRDTITNFKNWTAEFITQYQHDRRYGRQEGYCMKTKSLEYILINATYPEAYTAYVPENVCSSDTEQPNGAVSLYVLPQDTGCGYA